MWRPIARAPAQLPVRSRRCALAALARRGAAAGSLLGRGLLRRGLLRRGLLRRGLLRRGLAGGGRLTGARGPLARRRRTLGTLLGEQLERTLRAEPVRVLATRQARVGFAVSHVRPVPARPQHDRIARHRIRAELLGRRGRGGAAGPTAATLRLGEQRECLRQRDREDRLLAGQRAGLRALLDVRPVATVLG